MIPKELYRNKIRELFPSIPNDAEVEILLGQIDELLHKYGVLRVMTIGEVVKKVLEDSLESCGKSKA